MMTIIVTLTINYNNDNNNDDDNNNDNNSAAPRAVPRAGRGVTLQQGAAEEVVLVVVPAVRCDMVLHRAFRTRHLKHEM